MPPLRYPPPGLRIHEIPKPEGTRHLINHNRLLRECPGVKGVKVDLEKKTASVKAKSEISEDAFRAAIEEAGYEYCGKC